jgi:cytochrome c biogenesis protein ResB
MSGRFHGLWRSLSSLRFGIVLFVLVAVASLVGVLLPQPESFKFREYRESRLTFGAEEAMEREEFLSLADAAGILPDAGVFDRFVANTAAGKLDDDEARASYTRHLASAPEDADGRRQFVLSCLVQRAQQGLSAPEEWEPFFAAVVDRLRQDKLEDNHWGLFLSAFGYHGSQGAGQGDVLRLAYIDSYGTFLGALLVRLGVHELFKSLVFRLLCALLMLNLVVCSIRRLPGQWRAAFPPAPPMRPEWYQRRSIRAEAASAGAPDATAEELAAALEDQGFRVHRRTEGDAVALDATRGWLGALGRLWRPLGQLAGAGRLGSQVVHVGVLLVALGGFTSRRMSFRHPQLIGKGEVVAVPDLSYRETLGYQLRSVWHDLLGLVGLSPERERSPEEKAAETLDWREVVTKPPENPLFRVRLERFDFRKNMHGKAEYFRAHVTVLDTDPPLTHTIEVNRPLVYRGIHAYQESYQEDRSRATDVTFVVAEVMRPEETAGHSAHGQAILGVRKEVQLSAPLGRDVPVPGMPLSLRVIRYFPHWNIPLSRDAEGRTVVGEARNASPRFVNPAVEVRLETPGLDPLTRWVTLPFRPGEPRQGGMLDYGPYRIVPLDMTPAYSTWLTFKSHPVLLLVWAGCGLMMAGICLCFYCNHERVCALVLPGAEGGSQAFLTGSAFKWRDRFRDRFDAVAASIDATDGGT